MLRFDVVGLAIELEHGGEAAAEDDEGHGQERQAVEEAEHHGQQEDLEKNVDIMYDNTLLQFINISCNQHYFSYRTIIPRGDVHIGDKHP